MINWKEVPYSWGKLYGPNHGEHWITNHGEHRTKSHNKCLGPGSSSFIHLMIFERSQKVNQHLSANRRSKTRELNWLLHSLKPTYLLKMVIGKRSFAFGREFPGAMSILWRLFNITWIKPNVQPKGAYSLQVLSRNPISPCQDVPQMVISDITHTSPNWATNLNTCLKRSSVATCVAGSLLSTRETAETDKPKSAIVCCKQPWTVNSIWSHRCRSGPWLKIESPRENGQSGLSDDCKAFLFK